MFIYGDAIRQQVFDFHQSARLSWDDFVESDENREVMSYLRHWNLWQSNGLIIYGDHSVGKSHILTLWRQSANAFNIQLDDLNNNPRELFENLNSFAFSIDNVENFLYPTNYNWFFDFLNILKEKHGVVVMTALTLPSLLDISLQDLKSRLLSFAALKMSRPGDELLFHIAKKLAKDLDIEISDNCIQYMLNNSERNVSTIRTLINTLNKLSLEQKQAITLPFIRKYMSC